MSIAKTVQALRNMDTVLRLRTDEENGIFDTWIMFYVPAEATDEEIEEIVIDDPMFYPRCCAYFAQHVANMIVNGEWTDGGFTAEFYKPSKDRRLKQAPSSSHAEIKESDVKEFLDKAREAKASLEKILIDMSPVLSTENKEDKSAED